MVPLIKNENNFKIIAKNEKTATDETIHDNIEEPEINMLKKSHIKEASRCRRTQEDPILSEL